MDIIKSLLASACFCLIAGCVVVVADELMQNAMFTKNFAMVATEAEAEVVQNKLDTAMGYPRAGVDIGAGIHVPPGMSITRHQAPIIKHPTDEQWAIQIQGSEDKLKDVTPKTLTEDWIPTDEKTPNVTVDNAK